MIIRQKVYTLAVLATAIISISSAQADSWSVGVSALMSPNPYRETKDSVYPVPLINYESDSFYYRTLAAGYYLWKDDKTQFTLDAYYLPLNFKPGDSDDQRMKKLDKRRGTLMAGVSLSHSEVWGTLRTMLAADTLNNGNSVIADLAYLYKFTVDEWDLIPAAGVVWNSKSHNKYYYDINDNEANRSGLASYQPSDSWSPYLELAANYQINSSWNAFFMARYINLPHTIKESPMVNKSYTGIVWTGVTYTF